MQIIPYNSEQLRWHLTNNAFGLSDKTANKIIKQCELVNSGTLSIHDKIAPKSNVTIGDMLDDLQIDYN